PQIMTINRKVREEYEKRQAEAKKLWKQMTLMVMHELMVIRIRIRMRVVSKEEDDKMRTNAANVAAGAAVRGDDMLSKWQLMAEQARYTLP
ncbi:hypothetical protein S245_044935, partial [Arachis hypogaea]